jgi:endo-1,4-beta-xylanase
MTSVGGFIPPQIKPADISAMEFDYTMADEMLAFAEGHGMSLYSATGGWNTDNPLWITDGTYEEVKAYLDRKIELDLSHFKGKVKYWGMFNEVMMFDGTFKNRQQVEPWDILYGSTFAPYGGNYSPFVDGSDTSLIEYAFTKGRLVDPEAKLFLNDAGQERIGEVKAEHFYDFVVDMKNRGVPIDGVGFQLHLMYPDRPGLREDQQVDLSDPEAFFDGIDQNIKRYAEAGLLVVFTEFECQIRLDDIDFSTEAGREEYARRQEMQSIFYGRLIQLALDNSNVPFINIWTVADKPGTSAWDWNLFDEDGAALFTFTYTDAFLFDKNYDPKPAYYAVMDVLKP